MEKNKSLFEWVELPVEDDQGWGLPRYVDATSPFNLPSIFIYEDKRIENFAKSLSQAAVTAILDQIGKINLYNIIQESCIVDLSS